ncbi:response regulator transcription factor [Sphingosinithalassobacter portus]|uniref:response regulator transcription factor n=1 Tax=Stakelama portus TaxID=2676234 RepID=UPI000D6E9323|nr:response regulator [Sphingosinithalassobacter portus]
MIAIIDDDTLARAATEMLVRSLGYVTRSFASAEAFLIEDCGAVCIISDVQMPRMSGIDLQRALKTRGSKVPVILVTGFLDDAVRAVAMQLGSTALLPKSDTANHLASAIRAALA